MPDIDLAYNALDNVEFDPSADEPIPELNIKFPVIDLGYARHRAILYNRKGKYFKFQNIPYAAPPTGDRRFRKPCAPLNSTGISTGQKGYMCHQSGNFQFFLMNYGVPKEWQSEDCLFLDVYVPVSVFTNSTKKLPILNWIHGGGYLFGSKDVIYNPHGLMMVAEGNMIYVALNYRLGAFGFLAGSIMKHEDVTNLGLHDQRFALEWIQNHIEKFGGDPNQVTVMGESAGGSSIYHHLTSPEKLLFKRAILQSTAFYPMYDKDVQDTQFANLAELSGCKKDRGSQLKCLRRVPETDMAKYNQQLSLQAPFGTFQFGPYVDRTYVPKLPQFRLDSGKFNGEVEIMTGFNSREGDIFANPAAVTPAQFEALLRQHFPNATKETHEQVKALYPLKIPIFRRISSIISDWIVNCHSRYLDKAYPGSYIYKFAVGPGSHSIDLAFSFWPFSKGNQNPFRKLVKSHEEFLWMNKLSRWFQEYLVSFAIYGNPNYLSSCGIEFPRADNDKSERAMLIFKSTKIVQGTMDKNGPEKNKCRFWMDGEWTGKDSLEIEQAV
ncbi:Alpha/Beta hydrolase protein [Lipomyces oligophaga]|uniref:Alpha/Beta hydrolase protein n=1 Tax=Lipomyces oligophaga TaxID=45792 RepID=UPI0034CD059F